MADVPDMRASSASRRHVTPRGLNLSFIAIHHIRKKALRGVSMASVVEESYDSLPPAQRIALEEERQRLLQVRI